MRVHTPRTTCATHVIVGTMIKRGAASALRG
jgi:hypothetical protein